MAILVTAPATIRGRPRWAEALICLSVLLGTAGCIAPSPFKLAGTLDYDDSLLTGERVFGEAVSLGEAPRVAINQPSPEMEAYVADTVTARKLASSRFRELFEGLARDGYFESVYSANATRTAADTFEQRAGNCLSYTSMFIALARIAGLDARYQIVDVPPSWDADAGFLIRYTHVNVLLRNLRLEHQPGQDVIVDFNIVHPDPDYPREEVSDEYAESLFYANESVNRLRDNRPREAFALLRRAIDIAPENVDLWINLGAFYATQGAFDSAIEAYHVALQIDPRNKPAFSGLARSYYNVDDLEMATLYEEKVRNYRERNPYYYYALAQASYEQERFDEALEYVDVAISLHRRTARFHLLRGLVEHRLGHPDSARASLERAERYGLDRSVKLDLLRSLAGVSSS